MEQNHSDKNEPENLLAFFGSLALFCIGVTFLFAAFRGPNDGLFAIASALSFHGLKKK